MSDKDNKSKKGTTKGKAFIIVAVFIVVILAIGVGLDITGASA